jgi:stage III sporulation protein AE
MKKSLILLIVLICLMIPTQVHAQQQESTQDETMWQQLEELDLSQMEDALAQLDTQQTKQLFPNGLRAAIADAMQGGDSLAMGLYDMAKQALRQVFSETTAFFALLCVLSLLGALCAQTMGGVRDEGMNLTVRFACAAFCAVPLLARLAQSVSAAADTLYSVCRWMEAVMPVMLVLLSGIGASASVNAMQPASVVINTVVQNVVIRVVFPMILAMGALCVVDAMGMSRRFCALTDFLAQAVKWGLGCMLTVFIGVLTLRNLNAVSYDALGVRTMKYTLNSMPIVGGAVSDSMDTILSSLMMIKNGVGTAGVFAVAALCLAPVLRIGASMLCVRLCAAVMQPLAAGESFAMMQTVAEVFKTLLCVMIAVLLMFFLTVTLTIAAGNAAFVG